VGGQAVAAVEAHERAAGRLEEHRDAVGPLGLPAEALRVEPLGPVHVPDAEEDRAHVGVHALSSLVPGDHVDSSPDNTALIPLGGRAGHVHSLKVQRMVLSVTLAAGGWAGV